MAGNTLRRLISLLKNLLVDINDKMSSKYIEIFFLFYRGQTIGALAISTHIVG